MRSIFSIFVLVGVLFVSPQAFGAPSSNTGAATVGSACDATISASGKQVAITCQDNGCSKAGGACKVTNSSLIQALTSGAVDVTPACSCLSKTKGLCTFGTDEDGSLACGDNKCSDLGGTCKLYYEISGKKRKVGCGCDISPTKDTLTEGKF